jgi:hypothetical protein
MVYIDNSAINYQQGFSHSLESDDLSFFNVEDFNEALSPEEKDNLINFFNDSVHSQKKDEALARFSELKALRSMSKFKQDVSLNAMLTSIGYNTIRHSQNYQESSTDYLALDALIFDLESVLGSK